MVHDEAIELAQALEANLQSLHETGASDVAPVACIGLAALSRVMSRKPCSAGR
jgi:hypothetical protein